MTTSIEGRVARSLGLASFAHITATPLVKDGGITPNGVLFDGVLTDTEIGEAWWFATSADATDEAQRRALYALTVDPATPGCCVSIINYVLGTGTP